MRVICSGTRHTRPLSGRPDMLCKITASRRCRPPALTHLAALRPKEIPQMCSAEAAAHPVDLSLRCMGTVFFLGPFTECLREPLCKNPRHREAAKPNRGSCEYK